MMSGYYLRAGVLPPLLTGSNVPGYYLTAGVLPPLLAGSDVLGYYLRAGALPPLLAGSDRNSRLVYTALARHQCIVRL